MYSVDEVYGRRFHAFRLMAKKTQKEVCGFLGVTQSTLSKYESGKLQPPLDILVKMKELYRVPIDVLLGTVTHDEILNYMKNHKEFVEALKFLGEIEKHKYSVEEVESFLNKKR